MIKKAIIILVHALVGWGLCGAIMGIGRAVTTIETALIIHAIGAPILFTLITSFYTIKFNFTTPLSTALIFVLLVIGMDLFIVAPFMEKSFEMFQSFSGTWLPFILIFCSIFLSSHIIRKSINRSQN